MTTTKSKTFVSGNDTTYVAPQHTETLDFLHDNDFDNFVEELEYQEYTSAYEDDATHIFNGEDPDDYIHPDWFFDLFGSDVILVEVDRERIEKRINAFISEMEADGVDLDLKIKGGVHINIEGGMAGEVKQ